MTSPNKGETAVLWLSNCFAGCRGGGDNWLLLIGLRSSGHGSALLTWSVGVISSHLSLLVTLGYSKQSPFLPKHYYYSLYISGSRIEYSEHEPITGATHNTSESGEILASSCDVWVGHHYSWNMCRNVPGQVFMCHCIYTVQPQSTVLANECDNTVHRTFGRQLTFLLQDVLSTFLHELQ